MQLLTLHPAEPSPILTVQDQFTILSAIEDLETVTPRVFKQCQGCLLSTLKGSQTPSPRAIFKKSVSSLSASSFSLIGSEVLSGPSSTSASGVLVPPPGEGRGWDWRVGLPLQTETLGQEVLDLLRTGLARDLSLAALGRS